MFFFELDIVLGHLVVKGIYNLSGMVALAKFPVPIELPINDQEVKGMVISNVSVYIEPAEKIASLEKLLLFKIKTDIALEQIVLAELPDFFNNLVETKYIAAPANIPVAQAGNVEIEQSVKSKEPCSSTTSPTTDTKFANQEKADKAKTQPQPSANKSRFFPMRTGSPPITRHNALKSGKIPSLVS